jgi:hypothetical protein
MVARNVKGQSIKKNQDLVKRNIKNVIDFLKGENTNDLKCVQLTGVSIEELKRHFESSFTEKQSYETLGKNWDVGFRMNPNSRDMKKLLDRNTCFFYENMYVKAKNVAHNV